MNEFRSQKMDMNSWSYELIDVHSNSEILNLSTFTTFIVYLIHLFIQLLYSN